MNKKLIELIDNKISQLQRFNDITNQMLYEDIDGVGQLIDERQKIVTIVDGISVDIKKFISEQSIDRQDKLTALLKFEDIGELNDDLLMLQEKILEQQLLKNQIKENDKLVQDRIISIQKDLLAEMEVAAKPQKVVNYFSQTTIDINKGSKLNVSN